MATTMLHIKNLLKNLRAEVVNTTCYIINRVYKKATKDKTTYQLRFDKKHTVKCFQVFGSDCYILQDWKNLGKFNSKSNEGVFLGYSTNSHAYKVLTKELELFNYQYCGYQ